MSYNTSVQLGQTAFLICKVAPGVESVSKLSYRISLYQQISISLTRTPIVGPEQMSPTNYIKFFILTPGGAQAC